ncbi:MAG: succinate dehydrogenase assembly factor 2 [Alphaproteobacteria bacterium]|nr:MAG: succinate dehydrogenase assembly factor 2 [Alphaproteobacteria bacterium]
MSRELLLKEVKYRASYRGTLELDVVCRSLLPHLEELSDEELAAVAELLQQGENHLMSWLVEGKEVPEQWQLQVGLLRHFFKNRKAA